jgi:hypothetical protein
VVSGEVSHRPLRPAKVLWHGRDAGVVFQGLTVSHVVEASTAATPERANKGNQIGRQISYLPFRSQRWGRQGLKLPHGRLEVSDGVD